MSDSKKFLWRLEQHIDRGYDKYLGCIVCAYSEYDARLTHPDDEGRDMESWNEDTWVNRADLGKINCQCIGVADAWVPIGVVISSFRAG